MPIGSLDFLRQQLEDKSAEPDLLFHRIFPVEDTQACWLSLLMCAATRANFRLRAVHPDQSESFAVRHDSNVWRCMRAVLGSGRSLWDSSGGVATAILVGRV